MFNYEEMKNKIILADCIDIMKDIPDKYFELAIVDPPYGMKEHGAQNGGAGTLKHRAYNNGCIDRWDIAPNKEYFIELMRVSVNQIIWGGNYFDLPPTRCVICWDKCQPWENFSQWEMAWTSFGKPAGLFKFDNRTGNKIHPTQKPIALYRWLLQNYAKPGDKIIDTHSGSGSCAIACHLEKFDFLAIEKDEDYYKASVERLETLRSQGVLF